jgi:uncharacterized Tic20 family protein
MSVEGVSGAYPAVPTSDEKTMSMIAHAGGIFFGFLPALIVYLMKKDDSPFVKEQSTEALNFQITLFIGYTVSAILAILLIGILTGLAIWVGSVILMIMAAVAVNNGQAYRYPVNIRLIK